MGMLGSRDRQPNPRDEDGDRAQPNHRGPSGPVVVCIRTFRAHSCDSPRIRLPTWEQDTCMTRSRRLLPCSPGSANLAE